MSVVGRKDGGKWTGTYLDLHLFAELLLMPPQLRHQLLKSLATRWHLMASDTTLSFLIPFNTIIKDIAKLTVSIF